MKGNTGNQKLIKLGSFLQFSVFFNIETIPQYPLVLDVEANQRCKLEL